MQDRVLSATDRCSRGESVAVILSYVDTWPSRRGPDHQQLHQEWSQDQPHPIIMSFFENRRMRVKWHGVLAETKLLRGGGAQAGWVLSYLPQSNNNADCVPEDDRYKFVDYLTNVIIESLKHSQLFPNYCFTFSATSGYQTKFKMYHHCLYNKKISLFPLFRLFHAIAVV